MDSAYIFYNCQFACYTLPVKNVLLLPGWMTSLKLYGNRNDLHVSIGKLNGKSLLANYVIGVSLGALIALRDIENISGHNWNEEIEKTLDNLLSM